MLNVSETLMRYRHSFNGIPIGTYTSYWRASFRIILSDLAKYSVIWRIAWSLVQQLSFCLEHSAMLKCDLAVGSVSVCPSVCLSHTGIAITTTQKKWPYDHGELPQVLVFLEPNFLPKVTENTTFEGFKWDRGWVSSFLTAHQHKKTF